MSLRTVVVNVRKHPVVIAARDRIVFVIVTARAADGEAEEGAAGRREHVVDRVVARAFDFVGGDLRGEDARAEEAGGHQRERVLRLELVARDLPAHELIERHVVIQRLDDEVADSETRRPIVVMLEATDSRRSARHRASAAPSARRSAVEARSESINRGHASDDASRTNASISSGGGGSPSTSSPARRTRTRGSAAGARATPFDAAFSARNRSIAFPDPAGGAADESGRNDHHCLSSAATTE